MRYGKFVVFLFVTYLIGCQFDNTSNTLTYALITLPGTFLHECMHFITALVLDGHPHSFTIVPDGDTLGSVQFTPNWYNRATVGLAPLALAPGTVWITAQTTYKGDPFKIVFQLWIAACAWAACVPSEQDFSIAMASPSSWPLAALFLGFIFWGCFRIVRFTLREV